LPHAGAEFNELRRLGFVATAAADTAFFLADFKFAPGGELGLRAGSTRRFPPGVEAATGRLDRATR